MAKRVADKYITDQNWDKEEDSDENAGTGEFKRANVDALKNRVIRKARRRMPPTGENKSGMSTFSGFAGLKPNVGFDNNAASNSFKGFAMNSESTTFNISVTKALEANSNSKNAGADGSIRTEDTALAKSSEAEMEISQNATKYNNHLSSLNKSVSNWIKSHVEKNPLCDLSPIFNDYKKYLAEIDDKYGHSDAEGSQASGKTTSDSQESASPDSSQTLSQRSDSENRKFTLSGFGSQEQSGDKKSESSVPPKEEPKVQAITPSFAGFQTNPGTSGSPFATFGSGGLSKPAGFSGFTFSSSMVANKSQDAPGQQSATGDSEEYVPPKPESNVVVEDDAFYSIRCKLYYKKEESFADRGIGQLYLKPSGSKTQILVRADTAISQILLNILLTSSMPVQRQGKNYIMIMCIPNPPINEKQKDEVVAMLIRVKTSENADELFGILESKKKEES